MSMGSDRAMPDVLPLRHCTHVRVAPWPTPEVEPAVGDAEDNQDDEGDDRERGCRAEIEIDEGKLVQIGDDDVGPVGWSPLVKIQMIVNELKA